MISNQIIGVVIPCFKGGEVTKIVINEVLDYADYVVLVDDACPFLTGQNILKQINNPKLAVLFNSTNKGVGFSTKKGIRFLLEKGCDLILKIDADGQHDPREIYSMCQPIIDGKCEATKGNRFGSIDQFLKIPKIRLFGILVLSFITKFSSGYWDLFDPTNGLICFKRKVLYDLNLNKINDRYFFETDLLFRCSLNNVKVKNVNTRINYSSTISSLNPIKEIPIFFIKHIQIGIKRIIYQYFIIDFNPGSLEILLSMFMSLASLSIVITSRYKSSMYSIPISPGVSSLITITSLMAFQLLISFIYYDCTYRVLFRNSK